MQQIESAVSKIEYLMFELSRCVNDLSRYRLQINSCDIQQAELSLHKLESLISFVKISEVSRIVY
ncbi:hypothetical protein [Legionella sainthelensi]|uniref:Uncharacterized protein n=1 Tax=Legionella sainthelensi TaxID=28087 RepID=A0A2H5FM62_9GAMM|nr:hypothetical protein [Legionella sainthelensi]AUH72634.1 hypothetical protein CAB17_11670 [Legionella sainthelensi]